MVRREACPASPSLKRLIMIQPDAAATLFAGNRVVDLRVASACSRGEGAFTPSAP
jgi:hypothetical protein